MKNRKNKRKYTKPSVTKVKLDKDLAFIMMSLPPIEPKREKTQLYKFPDDFIHKSHNI